MFHYPAGKAPSHPTGYTQYTQLQASCNKQNNSSNQQATAVRPKLYARLGEGLSLVQQVQELGDGLLAGARVDLGRVEDARLLKHRALLDAVKRRVLGCGAGRPR